MPDTSVFKKGQVIALHQNDISNRQIAIQLRMCKRTVDEMLKDSMRKGMLILTETGVEERRKQQEEWIEALLNFQKTTHMQVQVY